MRSARSHVTVENWTRLGYSAGPADFSIESTNRTNRVGNVRDLASGPPRTAKQEALLRPTSDHHNGSPWGAKPPEDFAVNHEAR